MLTTIEATYDNGVVLFSEKPPVDKKVKVLVTFLEEIEPTAFSGKTPRKAGSLKGLIHVPEDFNEPLDDLKDYM